MSLFLTTFVKLGPDPHGSAFILPPGSGSAFRKTAGSGSESAKNECGSTFIILVNHFFVSLSHKFKIKQKKCGIFLHIKTVNFKYIIKIKH